MEGLEEPFTQEMEGVLVGHFIPEMGAQEAPSIQQAMEGLGVRFTLEATEVPEGRFTQEVSTVVLEFYGNNCCSKNFR